MKVFPGSDGGFRVAELKTKKGIITRAFNIICPLPLRERRLATIGQRGAGRGWMRRVASGHDERSLAIQHPPTAYSFVIT